MDTTKAESNLIISDAFLLHTVRWVDGEVIIRIDSGGPDHGIQHCKDAMEATEEMVWYKKYKAIEVETNSLRQENESLKRENQKLREFAQRTLDDTEY